MKNKTSNKMIETLFIILLMMFCMLVCLIYNGKQTKAEDDYIYVIMPNSSNEEMIELLQNRNGKYVIEIVEGRVLDNDGNGESIYSDGNYYIHYNADEFKKGDEVLSIFVYNPDTNYEDDITHRMDIKK